MPAILGLTLLQRLTPEELIAMHAAIGAGLENKALRPIVGKELPAGGSAARARSRDGSPGSYGKIVLIPMNLAPIHRRRQHGTNGISSLEWGT